MSTPVRLGLYGLLLVVLFGASALVARAVVPPEAVRGWEGSSRSDTMATSVPHDLEQGHR